MIFKIFLITFCLFLPFAVQGASSIDINTAPLEELEKIIGIGPVLAQKIIEARPFDSLDDLIKVKGIGEITLQKIKDQGLAWVDPQEELEPKPEPKPEPEIRPEPELELEEDSPLPTPEEKPTEDGPLMVEVVSYPTGIVFNEILPSPEGADAKNEWTVPTNRQKHSVFL